MPLAMLSRSHAGGGYRRRHYWRQHDDPEVPDDAPGVTSRAPYPMTSSVPDCDVIVPPAPPAYGSAFDEVVGRSADLQPPTMNGIIIIIIIHEYYYGGAVALLLQDHLTMSVALLPLGLFDLYT